MAKRAAPTALSAAAGVLAAAGAARQARAAKAAQPAAKPVLSASDRENPDKLTGEALRAFAHRRGIARSEAERMDDAKLRMQLRYITNRQYSDEET